MNTDKLLDNIITEANEVQKEMHDMIDKFRSSKRGKKISYNDLKDVFYMLKIAQLQEEIKGLKSKYIIQN